MCSVVKRQSETCLLKYVCLFTFLWKTQKIFTMNDRGIRMILDNVDSWHRKMGLNVMLLTNLANYYPPSKKFHNQTDITV